MKHFFLICVFFLLFFDDFFHVCKQSVWKRICLTLAFCWAGQLKPVVPYRCTTAYNLYKLIGTTNKQESKLALKIIRQAQQQRPESPMVTLTWRACKYKVYKLHQRYILAFENVLWWSLYTLLLDEANSLLLYLCYVFRVLINSLVCGFCTSALGLILFHNLYYTLHLEMSTEQLYRMWRDLLFHLGQPSSTKWR